jgi:REP element-mobilizing transposase RayT
MKYDPKKHHRRSIRLKGYNYASPGAYFVTICVQGRECLLGNVVNGQMRLNPFGQIADQFWTNVPNHFSPSTAQNGAITIDAHVTIPNHIHAIISIHDTDCRGAVSAPVSASIPAPVSLHSADVNGDQDGGEPEDVREIQGGTAQGDTKGAAQCHSPVKPGCAGSPPLDCETPPLRKSGPTLGQIVAYYKYQTTKLVNGVRGMVGERLWQRNYWEHVIRNDMSYQRIAQYVETNPALWENDQLHPDAPPNRFNRG